MKVLLLLLSACSFAQTLVPIDENNPYFIPISGAVEGDNMIVGGKFGKIYYRVFDGVKYVNQGILIDLEPRLNKSGEQGLLKVAIKNNQVYALFTALRSTLIEGVTNNANASIIRLVKWDLVDGQLVNERYVLGEDLSTGIPILSNNHVGGDLHFLEDGTLLVSTGTCQSCAYTNQAIEDGILTVPYVNGYYKAMQLSSLHGKILRIDAETGAAPVDNPYYPSKVYMLGLRNPFRFAVYNGNYLAVADVGEARFESINIANVPGSNLGFPYYEGAETYLAPNVLNTDSGTSFNTLITEAQSYEDAGQWQVRKASLSYGRFNNNYTKIVDANYNSFDAPDQATGISIIMGVYIPHLNALVYNDYFLNEIYFAGITNNYISSNTSVNTTYNSIADWIIDSRGNVFAISASAGVLQLNLETLNINQVSILPDQIIEQRYYTIHGQELKAKVKGVPLIEETIYSNRRVTKKIIDISWN